MWELWTEWSFSLILTWFLALSLRRQEQLVMELDQRGQELSMLLTVSGSVASTVEMQPLLDTVFDALGTVLDYSAIAVLDPQRNARHADVCTHTGTKRPRVTGAASRPLPGRGSRRCLGPVVP